MVRRSMADVITPIAADPSVLHTRWLGRVTYPDALALQQQLQVGHTNHLLLLEHPPTYTMGVSAHPEHVLVDVEAAGALLMRANRGGDVTYHGPGQLVGYPVLSVPGRRGGGLADTAAYVHSVEQVVIDALRAIGLPGAARRKGFNGVWFDPLGADPRKISAVGVRIDRGRSMHGFSINVDRRVDEGFARIVPCGIADARVTSIEEELAAVGKAPVSMGGLVDIMSDVAHQRWGAGTHAALATNVRPEDLAVFTRDAARDNGGLTDAASSTSAGRPTRGRESVRLLGRLEQAGVDTAQAVPISEAKPDWMLVRANLGPEYRQLKQTMRSLDLVTVCEEAGCPNIFECWNQGTATFMVLGERCTRACGFCLVDTRKPLAADPNEPMKVARAVQQMKLRYAVITMVARDDLADGGAAHVAATIAAIREVNQDTQVEALVSDHQGDADALQVIFDARPDVFNHNIETVLRLQRAVRPSASYAGSLAVLARAKQNGLVTKSGLIAGMGETIDELAHTLIDLKSVGVDIVTIGQYLRPTERHLPVARWTTPEEFEHLRTFGVGLGFSHIESSPLTRSSYHAREGADAARGPVSVTLSRRP
jgi:lipoyl synthase